VTPPNLSIVTSRSPLWFVAPVVAVIAGAAAARTPTAYVIGAMALILVVGVFLWRSLEPIVPFLLLVAAMQAGSILQLPLGDIPITTLMPILGGWTLLAALIDRRPRQLSGPDRRSGRVLAFSLIGLAAVVALTVLVQVWRPGGRLLSLIEVLTLVQLGVFVVLTAYLLSSPQRALWMAYVTIAVGAAIAVYALASRTGLVTTAKGLISSEGYMRTAGFREDPNFFSFQLLIGLAFGIHVALAAKTVLSRVLAWSAIGVILAGIVSTYSAGALVGVAAVLGTTVLLQFKVSAKRALAAFVLIAVATAVAAATAPPGYGEAVKAKYTGITSTSFEQLGTSRGAAWQAASKEVASNPVMGVGLSTENQVVAIAGFYSYSRVEAKAAHNMYLGIAVGTGIFGLAAFLAVLASCFAVLWGAYSRATRDGHTQTALATACLFTALMVVATQGLQLDLQLDKFTWLLVGASLAVRQWSRAQTDGSV
jgi:putative inorganic carbon (HCO3(-)) transporter